MFRLLIRFKAMLEGFGLSLGDVYDWFKIFSTYPGLDDRQKFRAWLDAVVGCLDQVAEATPNTLDDTAVDFAALVLGDDAVFDLLFGLIACEDEPDSGSPAVGDIGGKTGLDPATILLIVQAIRMLIDFIRSRRNG